MSEEKELIPELRFPEFEKDEEWKRKELGEIAEIVRGGSPRPIKDYLTADIDGLNWLKIADVRSDAKYVTRTKERVIQEAINSTREVNPGDLILSNSMSFGRPYILRIKTCIHDGWIAIRKISEMTYEDYLYYSISSEPSQHYFNVNAAGAAVKNLNAEIIKLLPIYLPVDKIEQQKIADCLSSLDELITAQNEKLEALKDHKKGLLQNLFPQEGEKVPKVRFQEFEDDGEWVEKTLGDVGVSEIVTDKINKQKLNPNNYVSTGNMVSDYGGITKASKLPSTKRVTQFIEGNILVSNIRPYLKKVWKSDRQGGASNDVIVFRSGLKLTDDFLEYTLKNDKFINYVMKSAKGVKMPRGDKDSMLKYSIRIPDIEEQQKIASCLSAVDELISEQADKIEELQEHKRGLMQGLFPKVEG